MRHVRDSYRNHVSRERGTGVVVRNKKFDGEGTITRDS